MGPAEVLPYLNRRKIQGKETNKGKELAWELQAARAVLTALVRDNGIITSASRCAELRSVVQVASGVQSLVSRSIAGEDFFSIRANFIRWSQDS